MASISLTVIVAGGKHYTFCGNSLKSINDFERILLSQANRLSLAWESHEIYA
jgi:hypothetical protein